MKRGSYGFSLIELLVVIAVIGIIAAVAMPSYSDMRDRQRVRAAAEAIYAHLHFARSESVKQDRDLFVAINTGSAWCLGIANAAGCNCATAGSCQFGAAGSLVERNLTSADFPGVSLATGNVSIQFRSRRGEINMPGNNATRSITVTGAGGYSRTVTYTSRGEIRL